MKKLATRLVAAAGLIGTPALAADMAVKAPPPPPALVYSWTGFYIGGNAGAAWGTFDTTTTTDFNPAPLGGPPVYNISNPVADVIALAAVGAQNDHAAGFTGGGQLGYNWQSGVVVFGVEADISYFHLSGSQTRTGPYPPFPPFTMTVNSQANTDWLFTARPRIGLASNNWLFYVTGGLALTQLHGNFVFTDNLGPALETGSISSVKAGWTIGGGVEAGLWDRWTVKGEYLYLDFAGASVTSNNLVALVPPTPFPANIFHHSADLKSQLVRVGLNYRLY
jgi:outer membrane immunogenic protein